jgi:hypothetical protein
MGNKHVCRKADASAIHIADLLNADGRSWNEEALNQNLLPFDVEAAK